MKNWCVEIIYPETVHGKLFRHEIVHQLRITIERYEREAWFILQFDILINISWRIFLDILIKNIALNKDTIYIQYVFRIHLVKRSRVGEMKMS